MISASLHDILHRQQRRSLVTIRLMRDPVHDYAELPIELMPVVDHPLVQRLRRIAQTPAPSVVYPSMTGRRFEHALGTIHLAGAAWDAIWRNASTQTRLDFLSDVMSDLTEAKVGGADLDSDTLGAIETQDEAGLFRLVGLAVSTIAAIHDIGQPPFSHALEGFYRLNFEKIMETKDSNLKESYRSFTFSKHKSRHFHEAAARLARDTVLRREIQNIPWYLVQRIMDSTPADRSWSGCLSSLYSGDADLDRLDYLLRDALNSGSEWGSIDRHRLVGSLELHQTTSETRSGTRHREWTLGFGYRSISALENLVIQRHQYYRWVVFHYYSVAANRFLQHCVQTLLDIEMLLIESGAEGSGAQPHPLPSLNYFAPPGTLDSWTSSDLASVDDGTITSWIARRHSEFARHRINVRDAEVIRPRFVSLAQIVLFRKKNWSCAWKTDKEYERFAGLVANTLRDVIRRQRNGWDRRFATHQERDGSAVYRRADSVLTCLEAEALGDDVRLVNSFMRLRLQGSASPTHLADEIALSKYITLYCPSVNGHRGFWIASFNAVRTWSFYNSTSVISDGASSTLSTELASVLLHMPGIEEDRAQFRCYFVQQISDTPSAPTTTDEVCGALAEVFCDVSFVESQVMYLLRSE